MCDEKTERENALHLLQSRISRRHFNTYAVGAALTSMIPRGANAKTTAEADISVETPDGSADCYFVHPASGQHPAVIMWPDILGLRPAFRVMGKRLAESGYAVLVVNPYYRSSRAPVVPEGASFGDPETRGKVMPLARTLSPETCVTDGRAFATWLDKQAAVDTNQPMGTLGYCMTGSYAIRLAAALSDRIAAGASFHGGSLVTNRPDSPHLLASDIKAGMLIAIAKNDHDRSPETTSSLRQAFTNAGVEAEIEVYRDAMHGWCVLDSRAYNEAEANLAWSKLLELFKRRLT